MLIWFVNHKRHHEKKKSIFNFEQSKFTVLGRHCGIRIPATARHLMPVPFHLLIRRAKGDLGVNFTQNIVHVSVYRDTMDLKSFRVSLLDLLAEADVRVRIVYNVLYIRSSHFMPSVLFYVTISSCFFFLFVFFFDIYNRINLSYLCLILSIDIAMPGYKAYCYARRP